MPPKSQASFAANTAKAGKSEAHCLGQTRRKIDRTPARNSRRGLFVVEGPALPHTGAVERNGSIAQAVGCETGGNRIFI